MVLTRYLHSSKATAYISLAGSESDTAFIGHIERGIPPFSGSEVTPGVLQPVPHCLLRLRQLGAKLGVGEGAAVLSPMLTLQLREPGSLF